MLINNIRDIVALFCNDQDTILLTKHVHTMTTLSHYRGYELSYSGTQFPIFWYISTEHNVLKTWHAYQSYERLAFPPKVTFDSSNDKLFHL